MLASRWISTKAPTRVYAPIRQPYRLTNSCTVVPSPTTTSEAIDWNRLLTIESYTTLVVVTRRDAYWMLAAVAAGAIATILWGERIGINGGQGWDGMDYAGWARDFPAALDHGVTRYQAQRVLPSLIVWLIGGSDHTVVRFQIADAVFLVGAALAWTRIAVALSLSRPAAWAGFAAAFASFAIARHALYYPTLTDSLAFALGMAMVWAYLAQRPLALWLVALAGAFTWPALPAVALGLLVLRKREV